MRRGAMAALAAAALLLAACGGDDGDGGAAEPSVGDAMEASDDGDAGATVTEPPAPDEEQLPAQPEVGELGGYTVNGTEFAVTSLNRCEPFSGSADDLDLQAIAAGSILNLPINGGTELDISVQGSAIEQEFGSISFAAGEIPPEWSVDGDRITGSATLEDALGSGSTVDVVWDVQIPDEINEC